MNEKLFIVFVLLNIANVVIQTVKSIATIKCGKLMASLANAIAYGLYTVVVIYMVCELPLWIKVAVVAGANLVGVYVVKLIEEKMRKDKLWKIECAVKGEKNMTALEEELLKKDISYNYFENLSDNYYIVNCFSKTQKESLEIKNILAKYSAKYFVTESKVL